MSGNEAALEEIRRKFQGLFQVDKLLGKGAMGAVYQVQRDGQAYALKVMLPAALADESTRVRFELEGKILMKLDHPNIMKVYETGMQDGWPYLLCELVSGRGLHERLEEGPIPWEEAFDHVMAVLDALTVAHKNEIIHRDIKPSNVLLTHDGVVKLSDFGIAKAETLEARKTTVGMIVGTPAYLAPEMIKNEKPSPRSDLYSVGVMLFELITGHLPFDSDNATEMLTMRFHQKAPPIGDFLTEAPKVIDPVIETALAVEPVNRFPSAATFKTALIRTRNQLKAANWRSATTRHRVDATMVKALNTDSKATGAIKARATGSNRAARATGRSTMGGDAVPPRLVVKNAAPASREKSLQAMAITAVAFLGVATIGAIVWSRGASKPDTRVEVSTGGEAAPTVTLDASDLKLVDEIMGMLAVSKDSPIAAAKLKELRSGETDRAAACLHRIWKGVPSQSADRVAQEFVDLESPVSVPPLVALLLSTPSPQDPQRASAAATLQKIMESTIQSTQVPDRTVTLAQLCPILKQVAENGAGEKPAVALAVIRLVGWFAEESTSRDCVLAVTEIPDRIASLDGDGGIDWKSEIRGVLERIDNEAAREMLTHYEDAAAPPKKDLDRLSGKDFKFDGSGESSP